MNILVQVTGSISVYKVCDVVSRLVKLGHEVKVCASKSSLKFVGSATWEGLTQNTVFSDDFSPGQRMNHINLNKWADLTLLAPASAKTLNQLYYGVGDGVINTLWLARDTRKPVLIFPAMNPKMWTSKSVLKSVNGLKKAENVSVFEPKTGAMACGDEGVGRLFEPEDIVSECLKRLPFKSKVLVTFGGTSESIDGVREISNFSTGKTGVAIVEELSKKSEVTAVFSNKVKAIFSSSKKITFVSSSDLEDILKDELMKVFYDKVIHLAAVSDFIPEKFEDSKISSKKDLISLNLIKRDKILNKLKSWSRNKDVTVISFKLSHNQTEGEIVEKIKGQLIEGQSDYVVHNSLKLSRDLDHSYEIWDKGMTVPIIKGSSKRNLVEDLSSLVNNGVLKC